jgi:hypothetical protein
MKGEGDDRGGHVARHPLFIEVCREAKWVLGGVWRIATVGTAMSYNSVGGGGVE